MEKRSISGKAQTRNKWLITLLVTLVPASPKKMKEIFEEEQRFKDPLCNSDSADKNYKKLNTQHYCFSRMESIALETVPPFCTTDHRFSVTLWCKLIDGALYSGTPWGFSQTNTSEQAIF